MAKSATLVEAACSAGLNALRWLMSDDAIGATQVRRELHVFTALGMLPLQ